VITRNELVIENDIAMDRLDLYERKMNNKDLIELRFDSIDIDGNLYIIDDEVRVQLDNIDIKLSYKRARYRAAVLDIPYMVMVMSVDRLKKVVHVAHNGIKDIIREELKTNINNSIDKKHPLTVMSKVTRIKGNAGSNHIIVDLGNIGIIGVIKMKDWGIAFTDNIRMETRYGDIIKVKVIKQILWNGKPAYSCSRKEAIEEDPWNGIEARLPKNTLVKVKCTSKTLKNFFGKIEGITGINAYCEYPDEVKNIEIAIGDIYEGYVSAVNEETKLLRFRIMKKLSS